MKAGRTHFIFGIPVVAAVISCISCHRETVETLTAACCVSICNSFKRLNKICSWSRIWECCDVLRSDWWIPPSCMLSAVLNLKRFRFHSRICRRARTPVLSSLILMRRFYATNCYWDTVGQKLFVFVRSDFCLCQRTNARKSWHRSHRTPKLPLSQKKKCCLKWYIG